MRTRKSSSWLTFNRVLKEGSESLEKWIDNADSSTIAEHIITLKNFNESKESMLSKEVFKIKTIIKNKNLNVNVISANATEYKTRLRAWTFNFVNLYAYEYTLFIGYDDKVKNITYWLISSSDLESISPTSRNAQTINGRISFPIYIPTNENSLIWKKFKKYNLDKYTLKNILNK